MTAMGVSRTVIREAVAALRARGLVITRQGAGAFVNPDTSRQPYAIDPDGLGSLSGVIQVLELRMAVEAEAAVLASERATAAQIKDIRLAQHDLSQAIANGDRGIKEDLAFHRTIAVATQNDRFVEFLEYLGRLIIPRQSIRSFDGRPGQHAQLSSPDREGTRGDPAGDRGAVREAGPQCHAQASLEFARAISSARVRT